MSRKPRTGLESIPGVGPSIATDLRELGYPAVGDLEHADPEEMYARLIHLRGKHQDRCVLYVFRCAVYYASTEDPDPTLLNWWAWKDRDFIPAGSTPSPRRRPGRSRSP